MKRRTTWNHFIITVIAVLILAGGIWECFTNQLIVTAAKEYEVTAAKEYEVTADEAGKPPIEIDFRDKTCEDGFKFQYYGSEGFEYLFLDGTFNSDAEPSYVGKISSDNEDVVELYDDSRERTFYLDGYCSFYIKIKKKSIGNAKITVSIGGYDFSVMVHVYSTADNAKITKIEQDTYKTAKFTWEKTPGASGYFILRALKPCAATQYEYDFKKIKIISDPLTTSYSTVAEYNKTYYYKVLPFVRYNNDYYYPYYLANNSYTLPEGSKGLTVVPWKSNIKSATKSGSKGVKLTWNKTRGAISYEICMSTGKNGTYKPVKTINDPSQTSVTLNLDKVTTYYYKLYTYYPDGSKMASNVVSFRLSGKGAAKKTKMSNGALETPQGQYALVWAKTETDSYYILDGVLHIVKAGKNKITDYTMSSSLKIKRKKVIKIKYKYWGGFYKDDYDNFYVIVGYGNPSESKSKTVIKIIKYNKNWKKIKTTGIKGSASNVFKGIYIPFASGSCRMDIIGSKLYIHTCREMFEMDGIHHQSNISFQLDTKTMKVKTANDSYASHSFNQFVKSDGDNLYLLDHGDGYPRSIQLTIIKNYRKIDESNKPFSLFDFDGSPDNIITRCMVGGMEVGRKNVLVCGISYPNKYKVRTPKKGENFDRYNVFVLVANKETGKKKLKWLTTYSNKNANIKVGETRMVKIDDNHFAVLYNTSVKNKTTLHYVVLNNSGKVVYKKNYRGYEMNGGTQPILYGKYIVWYETGDYDNKGKRNTYIYRIPARY